MSGGGGGGVRRRVRRATSPAGPPRPGARPGPPSAGTAPRSFRQTAPVPDIPDDAGAPPAGTTATATLEQPPDGRARQPLDLLIWDAPNIDMTLSTVIGARPTAETRPRF